MNFKEELAKIISTSLNIDINIVLEQLEVPSSSDNGDYSFPCFKLAKNYKKSPNIIAEEESLKITKADWINEIKVEGAYINFFIDKGLFAKCVITKVLKEKDEYGKENIGEKKKIVMDFSSPNIAKPFHIGHLRSTVIGNALYNAFNYMGYTSVSINHLGDWGTQFGKLIVAYRLWGDKQEIEKKGINELMRLYVKFHDEAEKDNSLEDEARNWLIKMQDGDEEAITYWTWFRDISIIEFNRIYDMLDIKFDSWRGESFYTDKMHKVIEELEEKNILIESNGAKVVSLEEYNMPPCLILRKDGGTLYPTRDIAAAIYRKETYNFEKCLIVVALDQSLHFKQFFKVIELMGRDWAKDLVHVGFGLVRFAEGKLSTRKGNVVLMEDIIKMAINKTRDIIQEKNPTINNKEEIAKDVAIGAIIFNDLYNSRIKDVVFSFESMLNFEGDTGPYVQYTHVRACSILNKAKLEITDNINFSILEDKYSKEVLTLVAMFSNKILEVINKYEPYILSRYLIDLCKAFNKFYINNSVLSSEEDVKVARLAVVLCVKQVLNNGLSILGIKAPTQM